MFVRLTLARSVAIAAVVAVAASSASGQLATRPPLPTTGIDPEARAVMREVVQAVIAHDPRAVVARMSRTVRFEIAPGRCSGKQFMAAGRVTGTRRLALARCMVAIGMPGEVDDDWVMFNRTVTVVHRGAGASWTVNLQRIRRELVIIGVRYMVDAPLVNFETGEGAGSGGVESGVAGNVAPPPPPPAAPPPIVPPTAFEEQRIVGDKYIFPDDDTKAALAESGRTQLVIPIKVCVSSTGGVTIVSVLKASGFPAYDEKLRATIKTWRYRPFLVDGAAVPVCSIVQFVYRQR